MNEPLNLQEVHYWRSLQAGEAFSADRDSLYLRNESRLGLLSFTSLTCKICLEQENCKSQKEEVEEKKL